MTCLLCLDANEYAAHRPRPSAQQKTRRGVPPGHSGVVSVNTLFWKILVTRVKQKICDASVVSLSCCLNSGFARVRHYEWAKSDCGRERARKATTAPKVWFAGNRRRLCANPRGCG